MFSASEYLWAGVLLPKLARYQLRHTSILNFRHPESVSFVRPPRSHSRLLSPRYTRLITLLACWGIAAKKSYLMIFSCYPKLARYRNWLEQPFAVRTHLDIKFSTPRKCTKSIISNNNRFVNMKLLFADKVFAVIFIFGKSVAQKFSP